MYRDCPERTSVAEGSRGRAILGPTVGVSTSGGGATSGRGRGRGRITTTDIGISRLESLEGQDSRPQIQARVFAMTK